MTSLKLRHMFDPARLYADGSKWRGGVHYAAPDGQGLLCGHGSIYREIDGKRYQLWQETERPITCKSCTQQIRVLARMQIEELNASQVEELLDRIAMMRANGSAPAPDADSAGGQ